MVREPTRRLTPPRRVGSVSPRSLPQRRKSAPRLRFRGAYLSAACRQWCDAVPTSTPRSAPVPAPPVLPRWWNASSRRLPLLGDHRQLLLLAIPHMIASTLVPISVPLRRRDPGEGQCGQASADHGLHKMCGSSLGESEGRGVRCQVGREIIIHRARRVEPKVGWMLQQSFSPTHLLPRERHSTASTHCACCSRIRPAVLRHARRSVRRLSRGVCELTGQRPDPAPKAVTSRLDAAPSGAILLRRCICAPRARTKTLTLRSRGFRVGFRVLGTSWAIFGKVSAWRAGVKLCEQ